MNIRPVETSDAAALAEVFVEMDRHYGGDDAHAEAEITGRIVMWIETQPGAIFLLAEDSNGMVLGHLSAVPMFPSGGGGNSSMFVKDIYVRDGARGNGVGGELLRACAREANKRGSPRLDLTVDRANDGAARLYLGMGAKDAGKSYLRWDGDGLAALAGTSEQ